MKKAFFALLVFLVAQGAFCNEKLDFSLWAMLDADPKFEYNAKKDKSIYQYSIDKIRAIGADLVSGMLFGWDFEYTPSDVMRRVEEYFDFQLVQKIDSRHLHFFAPKIEDNKLICRVEFQCDDGFAGRKSLWQSSLYRRMIVRGESKMNEDLETPLAADIENAFADAIKAAVRSHVRATVKNKPKSITGHVALVSPPKIDISNGRYVVSAEFSVRIGNVTAYSVY